MRLIDADKLKKAFVGNRYGTKAIEYVINDMPTVNAIPIEWVKLWLENNSKTVRNPDYYDWDFTQEPIDYYITIYPHEVERMLNDWEKENE